MKRKRLLAAVIAAVMASTLTMSMPMPGYAMDQGTETVANEPEGSNSSDVAATNPELDAESVAEESASTDEFAGASESQETEPDTASAAENTEAESGAVAAPETQNNAVGAAEENGAASAGTVGAAESSASNDGDVKIKKFGDFNYVEETRGVVYPRTGIYILSYTGNEASITIPDAIDGKTVVGIKGRVFDSCTSLQQVTFSKNLTQIGEEAFWGCTNLKKIVFLGNDTEGTNIGEYAFGKCTALQDVTLRDYITIGNGAFSGCKALTQITLPDSVHLGIGAFSGTSLKEITIPDTGWDLTETFIDCKSLQKVTILGGVDTGNRTLKCTFFGCTSLQEVSIFNNPGAHPVKQAAARLEGSKQSCRRKEGLKQPASGSEGRNEAHLENKTLAHVRSCSSAFQAHCKRRQRKGHPGSRCRRRHLWRVSEQAHVGRTSILAPAPPTKHLGPCAQLGGSVSSGWPSPAIDPPQARAVPPPRLGGGASRGSP